MKVGHCIMEFQRNLVSLQITVILKGNIVI